MTSSHRFAALLAAACTLVAGTARAAPAQAEPLRPADPAATIEQATMTQPAIAQPRDWAPVTAAATAAAATAAGTRSPGVAADAPWTLDALIALARRDGPAFRAERARIAAAEAGVLTARARPNPDLELLAGRQDGRGTAASGGSGAVGVLQPLERSSLRSARRDAALAGLDATIADTAAFERDRVAEVKLRYHDVLRAQAALRLAEEDFGLAAQIRDRVAVRVGTGEAPRFELIRADAERLNAQRAVQASRARIDLARAELRRTVGPALPADFSVSGSLDDPLPPLPSIELLRERLLERHPELQAARASIRAAEKRVALERERARPAFALRASVDRVPETVDARLGVVVQLPVFDRREGPIAEGLAELERGRFLLADVEQRLDRELEAAWQRQEIALAQIAAYESGILPEAEAALRVAEAAYRFGERGILDVLDAQRTVRSLRSELNATRYDLRAARVDLERLGAESE